MDHTDLIRGFEDGTWPLDRWDHRAHLTVAWTYLKTCPFEEATERMRAGVRRYNAANDVAEGIDRGYHDTITVAWMRILHATMQTYGHGESADAFLDDNDHFLGKRLLRVFYSRDCIMSAAAKERFIEPDLAPLPESVA